MQSRETVFWQLVEENRVSLYRFAYALTRSDDEAKDLVSETVLAAHTSFPKLRDVGGFRKSLYTIARRLHRRKTWRSRIFSPLEAGNHIEESQNESSHDIDVLLQALHSLPNRQREAVMLFELSGLSLEEIRTIQGGSLSGVKSRVARGRETLQTLLSDTRVIVPSVAGKPAQESLVPSILL